MESASDVRRAEQGHQRLIVTKAVAAKALAQISVEVYSELAHSRGHMVLEPGVRLRHGRGRGGLAAVDVAEAVSAGMAIIPGSEELG
jgi:hypothetical protein